MKKLLTILFVFIPFFVFSQKEVTMVSIDDFGADPTGQVDCSAALKLAMAALPPARTNWGIPSYGQGTVTFGRGTYRFDSVIKITTTINLLGLGSGYFPYQESNLRFIGTGGISVLQTKKGYGAKSVTISNLSLRNFGVSTDSSADGIFSNTRIVITNVAVDNFGGNGIAIVTSDSGNANNSILWNVTTYYNAKNGIFFAGNDSNKPGIYSSNSSANGMCGICDFSFLGINAYDCHVSSNGVRSATGYSKTWARHGGKFFQSVKYPSQTKVEPEVTPNWQAYWVENSTTFSDTSLVAAWSADSTYWICGAYVVAGVAATSHFYGCYSEGGEGKSIMNEFSVCWGGDQGAGFAYNKNLWLTTGASRLLLHGAGFKSYDRDSTKTFFGFDEAFGIVTGTDKPNQSQTQLKYYEADKQTHLFNDNSKNNLSFSVIGRGFNPAGLGLSSLPRTGGIIFPYFQGFYMGNAMDGSQARNVSATRTTPPTTGSHAIGDFVLYMGSDSTIIGYRCISTSPLTWKTLKAAN